MNQKSNTIKNESKNLKETKLACSKCGKTGCAMYQNNYNGKNYCYEHSEYALNFQE